MTDKAFPIEEAKTFAQAARGPPGSDAAHIPGPAYYKAVKEPKKISFLFNPAEKWT